MFDVFKGLTASMTKPLPSPAAPLAEPFLELCVESVSSAKIGVAHGADQLELCSALALGGLTPSAGLVETVLAEARGMGVLVRAMVRPRAGDFDYDADMLMTAINESRQLLRQSIDGLVFGATKDGALCRESLERWRDAVRTSPGGERVGLTLHRAIDVIDDPVAGVRTAIDLGFDQVLSSGSAPNALAGAAVLARMREAASDRVRVVAGSGVTPTTLFPLIAATGLSAVHASARSRGTGREGTHGQFGDTPAQADPDLVRQLRMILDRRSTGPSITNHRPMLPVGAEPNNPSSERDRGNRQ